MKVRGILPGAASGILAATVLYGCSHDPGRALRQASRDLGQAVGRGDEKSIAQFVVPGARASIDSAALVQNDARKRWAKTLNRPVEVRAEALMSVPLLGAIRVVETPQGWRLAEDSTDLYRQDTPRNALRAFVLATHMERWDVLVGLAPRRFRIGLSSDDLALAWTKGHQAQALRDARDRVSANLEAPIVADAHDAVLTISDTHHVRLEREVDRWVIADFLPVEGSAVGQGA